jgi:NAD(P)-dependent dehydrogenase (short-subunit alcohol dehydrogenase family)
MLVTGGAGAIGFETCSQLLAANATVVVNGRNADRNQAAAAQLRADFGGARVFPMAADLADYSACAALVAEVEATAGRIDGVIHSAVTGTPGVMGPFEHTDPAGYTALMQNSLCTLLNICHAALPALRRAGGGSIVAFSSDAGKVAAPNQTLTGATRAGAMMFIRSLALEVSAYGVRCNCISPTFVQGTPIYDRMLALDPTSGRAARATSRAKLGLPTASDIAALTVFLCSRAGAHLTGQVISVNGGLSAY